MLQPKISHALGMHDKAIVARGGPRPMMTLHVHPPSSRIMYKVCKHARRISKSRCILARADGTRQQPTHAKCILRDPAATLIQSHTKSTMHIDPKKTTTCVDRTIVPYDYLDSILAGPKHQRKATNPRVHAKGLHLGRVQQSLLWLMDLSHQFPASTSSPSLSDHLSSKPITVTCGFNIVPRWLSFPVILYLT